MIRFSAWLVAALGVAAMAPWLPAQDPNPVAAVRKAEVGDVLREGPIHEAFERTIPERPEMPPPAAKAPPEPIRETPPDIAPEFKARAKWIPGYWSWDEDARDFLWVSGVWRFPPPGHRWVPGRWAPSDEGPRRVEGFWVKQGVTQVALLADPPPAVPEKAVVTKEAPRGQFWVPGYHVVVDGKYQWREGFAAKAIRDLVWTPAHTVWTPNGWAFVEGFWDYPLKARGQVFAALDFHTNDYLQPDFQLVAAYPVPLDSIAQQGDVWTYRLDENADLSKEMTVSFVAPAANLAIPAAPVPPVGVIRGVARRGKLTQAGILVRVEASGIPETRTDANGVFTFRDVPYGEYTIVADGALQNIIRTGKVRVQLVEPLLDKVEIPLQ
jgi:hypothetical protein